MVKKFIAVLVCVSIIVTTLIASGCALKDETIQPAVTERVKNVYKTEYLSLPEKYTPRGTVFKAGNRIYTVCNETLSMDEYSGEYQVVLYSVDMNGENPESRIIESQLEGGYISNSTVTSDGLFVFIENSYNMDTMAQTYLMTGIDKDGNILFSVDPSEMISAPADESSDMLYSSSSFYVYSIASDSSGNIFILTGLGILVLSSDGNKLFEILSENIRFQTMSVSGNKVMVSYYDSSYNTLFAEIDMEAKKIGEEIKIPEGASQYNKSILLGDGYDYYIKDTTGVYGFNEGDESLTLLMNWVNSDIMGSNIYEMTVIDADTFMYLDNVRMAGEAYTPPQIAVLKRIPDDEVLAKYLIRLVVLDSYLPNNLTSNIVKFNRNSLTHRVYIDDYSRYNDPNVYEIETEAVKTLSVEIASGKIPDMVLGNSSFILLNTLEDKGTFTDLYELIDNDPDISRDDFLKCIRLPFENDGKLYKLITSFAVNSIIGKTANIGHLKENWNLDTMIEYSKSLPEGTTLFANATSDDMLLTFTIIGLDDFINWETKECKFDDETFINVLEYAKTFPQSIDYSALSSSNRYEDQRNDKTLLESFYLSSFSDYLRIRYAFGTDDLTILGYPGALGGAIVTPQDSYSISAKSAPEVREGAWQFLKQLVTDTSRLDSEYGYGYSWLPTYEALEKIADGQMKMGYKYFDNGTYEEIRYYTDIDGNEQEMSMMSPYGVDRESAETQRLTDEDITFVKDFLDNVTSKITYDQKIISIIQDESKAFFEGTKTAGETAKIIQSMISIYVSESK